MNITHYEDINLLLSKLSHGVTTILGNNLVGVYLFGSLSYGDFDMKRSDIDLLIIVNKSLSAQELQSIKELHEKIYKEFPVWKERMEASYTPLSFFSNIEPPISPRPYFGEGKYYLAEYGNEWIINNYLLYHHGIAINGPEFKTLIDPIDITLVQKASVRDLFKEWEPKLRETEWLDNSHYQSYLVLNLCRILNTALFASILSKKKSALAIKNAFPEWSELIQIAERWEYGQDMLQKDKTLAFLKFTIEKVNEAMKSNASMD